MVTDTKPSACPFCGEELRWRSSDGGKWIHPGPGGGDDTCVMVGIGLDSERLVELWNERTAPPRPVAAPPAPPAPPNCIYYEVHGKYPVFNSEGRGIRADATMLNAFFAYVEEHLDKA